MAGIKFEAEGYGEFKKALNDIKSSLKVLNSELKLTKSEFDKNDNSVTALTAKNKTLSKVIEEQKKCVDQLAKGVKAATEEFGENDKRTQDLTAQYNKEQAQLNKLEREYESNEKAVKNYGKAQVQAVKDSEEFKKAQEKLKDTFDAVKKAAAVAATAIGTALTASAKAAIDYQDAFAGVVKTVDATDEQLAKLSDGIREMSKEIPTSANDIAAIAESAGQLGIQTDNILGFTRVIADLGVATNLSGEEAASSLAKFANITQMPQTEFDKLGSTIVALGNNLATTEADIVSMGMRLAGAGKQVGMTDAQIMSFAGALSSVGIEAEAGGSAFSKVMIEMQLAAETGGAGLQNFAKVAGMSASEFAKAYKEDAAGAMIAFIKGLSTSEEKGVSAIKVLDDMGITETRMRDALLRAAGASDVFTESLDIGTKAWEENTALSKEAETRYGTVKSQLQILKNTFVDLGIEIGEQLMPIIQDFTDKLKNIDTKPIVDAFSWIIENGSTIISTIAAIGAGMLAWNVTTTIQAVIAAIKVWKEATEGMALSQKLLNVAMAANPVGIVITAIAALVAGIVVLWNTNEDFRNKVTGAWNAIKDTAENVFGAVTDFFTDTIPNAIKSLIEWFENLPENIASAISGVITALGEWAASIGEWVVEAIPAVIESIVTFFAELPENIGYAIGYAIGTLASWAVELIDWAVETIPQVIDSIITFFKELPGKIWDAIVAAVDKLGEWAAELISWAQTTIPQVISNIITFFTELPGKIWDAIVGAVQKLGEWAANMAAKAAEVVPGIVNDIVSFFEKLPGRLIDIGVSAIKGLIKGFWDGMKNMGKEIKSISDNVVQGFKDGFKVNSPSKRTMEIGKSIMEGLWLGMQDKSGKLMETVDDIAKELLARLSGALSIFSTSSDISGLQYDLWESTVGKTATSDEKSKKKLESLNEQAKLQEQQIDTTKKAYAKMVDLYGAEGEESLKLQKQLLQEQLAYEKLKKSIDEVANAKSNVNADKLASMAEQEYKLWFLNTPDATDVEKLEKQSDVLAYKLDLQTQSVSDTEAAFADAAKQYGVNSDESIKLQEQLLKEKIAYAELKKQIDEVTKALSQYGVVRNVMETSGSFAYLGGMKKAAYDTAPQQLSAQAVGGMISNAVNAMGTMNGGQKTIVVQNPLYINGRELARATMDDFRVVEAASPQVRSDRF